MLAYSIQEPDEWTGGVYFARHSITAKKAFADEFNDGEIGGVICHRAPWADEFAESKVVPAKAMIAHGWHFECSGCGHRIDEDWLADEGKPLDGVIGSQWSMVFCGPDCEARHDEQERQRKTIQDEWIAMLKSMVLARFPDAKFSSGDFKEHAYASLRDGHWIIEQCVVSFEFPGMKIGPATLRYGRDYSIKIGPVRPRFSCCNGDLDAFQAYAEMTRRAA